MALTNTAVKNAKSDGKTVKMFDERGLVLPDTDLMTDEFAI